MEGVERGSVKQACAQADLSRTLMISRYSGIPRPSASTGSLKKDSAISCCITFLSTCIASKWCGFRYRCSRNSVSLGNAPVLCHSSSTFVAAKGLPKDTWERGILYRTIVKGNHLVCLLRGPFSRESREIAS